LGDEKVGGGGKKESSETRIDTGRYYKFQLAEERVSPNRKDMIFRKDVFYIFMGVRMPCMTYG